MKLAFFADSQVDERSRLAEHDRVCSFIVSDAKARGCVALLHGGDVFERRSTVLERESVNRWIAAATESMAVLICAGNHETAGEVAELNAAHSIEAVEVPSVTVLEGGPAVAFLPWPRRERLHEWLGRPASSEEVDATATELLRDVLRGLGAELAKVSADVPRVLVAHVAVSGYRTDPDQPAHVSSGMEVSIEDLMLAGADIVLLGHIHMPQHWVGTRDDGAPIPIIYSGSPRRTAYASGELVPKGYVVVEFEGRRLVRWDRIPTPATPMILVEAVFDSVTLNVAGTEVALMDEPPPPIGAEVRLRYSVDAEMREGARRIAKSIADAWVNLGAAEVQIEEVVLSTSRARMPELAACATVFDRLRLKWERDGDVDSDRAARLVACAESVEGGIGA